MQCDDEVINAIKNYKDFIKKETLAIDLEEVDLDRGEVDLNGHVGKIVITKK